MQEFNSNETEKETEDSGMKLHLENFDGPLDLLLHLIKSAKIDIKEVFVSKVTDQFLLYIEEAKKQDIEIATDYLVVASSILEIKSRELLPKYQEEDAEEENNLIFLLEEYKMFKELSEKLGTKQELDVFYREIKEEFQPNFKFEESSLDLLVSAFQKVLLSYSEISEGESVESHILAPELLTVDMVMQELSEKLEKGSVSFFSLFSERVSKTRVVTSFLAILEMIRLGLISAKQEDTFDDIIIKRKKQTEA